MREVAVVTLRAQIINPTNDPRWQSFVDRCGEATIFHHVSWLRLLSAQYRYPLRAHCVVDNGGEIRAGIPFASVRSLLTGNRLVALPFSDLCPPLAVGTEHGAALEVLAAAVQEAHERDRIDIEVRGPLGSVGATGKRFYHHRVALSLNMDEVTAGFNSMVRRGVSRARRDGVEVREGTTVAALDEFYRLHQRTRARQGVPTQPKQFIRRFASLFDEGLGFVLLAIADDTVVAGAVYLRFNGQLVYKYGASSPEHLKRRPNHAIFNEAIRRGCETGMREVDLGRTDLDNEGLRAFKLGWGAEEHRVSYVRLMRKTHDSDSGVPSYARALISKTPPITGRLIGAALYRHFG